MKYDITIAMAPFFCGVTFKVIRKTHGAVESCRTNSAEALASLIIAARRLAVAETV
jgi:hypothetical protein